MEAIGMDALLAKLNAARAEAQRVPTRVPGVEPGRGTAQAPAAARATDFSSMLAKSIGHVDQAQRSAASLSEQFQLGAPNVSLEGTMVAVQKANIEFQALVQVRNKVIAAYTDIMNMQV
jgi:flagellar hook-basal body complex protein FliE